MAVKVWTWLIARTVCGFGRILVRLELGSPTFASSTKAGVQITHWSGNFPDPRNLLSGLGFSGISGIGIRGLGPYIFGGLGPYIFGGQGLKINHFEILGSK